MITVDEAREAIQAAMPDFETEAEFKDWHNLLYRGVYFWGYTQLRKKPDFDDDPPEWDSWWAYHHERGNDARAAELLERECELRGRAPIAPAEAQDKASPGLYRSGLELYGIASWNERL